MMFIVCLRSRPDAGGQLKVKVDLSIDDNNLKLL